MRRPYVMPMAMLVKPGLFACLAATMLASVSASASTDSRAQMRAVAQRAGSGNNIPAREIESRVIPSMPGAQYLGFVYDAGTNIYTLKFLRNGSVIWVDVDARTGRIIRRTGS